MTANDELLPCPFCGGGAVKWRETSGGKSQRKVWVAVSCISESCPASSWKMHIQAWNTRTQPYTHAQVTQQSSQSEDVCKELVDKEALRALVEAFRKSAELIKNVGAGYGWQKQIAENCQALTPFTQQKE